MPFKLNKTSETKSLIKHYYSETLKILTKMKLELP